MQPLRYAALRLEVLTRDGHTCQVCGSVATEVDHRWSAVMGGGATLANLQAVCIPCNRTKAGESTGSYPGPPERECSHCHLGEPYRRDWCRPCWVYHYRTGHLPSQVILDRRLEKFVAATNPSDGRWNRVMAPSHRQP